MPLWMWFVRIMPGQSQAFSEEKRPRYHEILKGLLQDSDTLIVVDPQTDEVQADGILFFFMDSITKLGAWFLTFWMVQTRSLKRR